MCVGGCDGGVIYVDVEWKFSGVCLVEIVCEKFFGVFEDEESVYAFARRVYVVMLMSLMDLNK